MTAHIAVALSCLAALTSTSVRPLAAQQRATVPATPARAAQSLVDEGVAKAAVAHKRVLVKFGASWCGPCQQMDAFLKDTTGVGAIMSASFVVVGLTALEDGPLAALNNPGAEALATAMGGTLPSTGIPYYFILDETGKRIGDSKAMPDGANIGYPEEATEVEGFDRLLQRTAPRMTVAERARIKEFLDMAAGRRPPPPKP